MTIQFERNDESPTTDKVKCGKDRRSELNDLLLYPEFMRGMRKAPWDDDVCGSCGGNGLKPVYIRNGHQCGCKQACLLILCRVNAAPRHRQLTRFERGYNSCIVAKNQP